MPLVAIPTKARDRLIELLRDQAEKERLWDRKLDDRQALHCHSYAMGLAHGFKEACRMLLPADSWAAMLMEADAEEQIFPRVVVGGDG